MAEDIGDLVAERTGSRNEAVTAVRDARGRLSDVEHFEGLPTVIEALDLAERELSVPLTECRLEKPYAPIMQVGDSTGLHYVCTHSPSHNY